MYNILLKEHPMQIRCYNCKKPFALNKEVIYLALDQITEQELSHYDAPCPHCRRINRVSRQELMRAAPEWKNRPHEEIANE